MIKFFRHIRQQLIMKNKTGKPAFQTGRYFKYAIGEIILVVIGILIALQINNWNETQKKSKREATILVNLKEDLTSDLMKLDSLKKGFEASVNSKKVFEDVFDNVIESIPLVRHFKNQYTVILIDFVPNTITIDQIKNSEESNIISSPELSRQLYALYNNYEVYRTKLKIALDKNQQMINYTSHYYRDVLEPSEAEINSLLKDKYFVNLIRANFSYGLNIATDDIYAQCEKTLKMIEKELR